MKLSIIIVNYNGGKDLKPCLTSVYRETKAISFEVILVDNGSTDGSVEIVEENFPQVRIIRNEENRGFAAANNIAIRQAAGQYILLLNPDTEVLNRAIEKTIEFMEDKLHVGIVGCKLVYPDRSVQPSVRPFPSVIGTFLEATFLYLVFPSKKVVRRNGIPNFEFAKTQKIDWLIGAYFMIRRSVLDKLGLLDEQFWIYGEEIDYCQRARSVGYETWYVADAEVIHHYGGMIPSLRVIVWLHFGWTIYIDKHYRGLTRLLITYLLYFGSVMRIIVYPIIGTVTFNKNLFAKAYYYAVGLFKVSTQRWKYEHHHVDEVVPWTRYL
jgi:GT2 family glycosyltransferase